MTGSLALRLNPLLIAAVLVLSVGLLTSACGGGDGGGGSDTPAGGERPSDGAGGAGPVTFDVSMADSGAADGGAAVNFFEPDELSVSPGQEVTFNLTNDGLAPHNTRIAGPDGEYDTGDDTVSEPGLLEAGDATVLSWTAPDEPGTIEFRCDFHPADMVGTITVESPSG